MKSKLVPEILSEAQWITWIEKIQQIQQKQEYRKEQNNKFVSNKEFLNKLNTVIQPQDFMIKVHNFQCVNKGHDLIHINAEVLVKSSNGGNIILKFVPAGYCKQCDYHFILSSIFEENSLFMKNALCEIVPENNISTFLAKRMSKNNQLATQSILKYCGYSVSWNSPLTQRLRIQLLNQIIEKDILSRLEIMNFLNWLINFSVNNSNMQDSIPRWRSDLRAISKNSTSDTVRVEKITHN